MEVLLVIGLVGWLFMSFWEKAKKSAEDAKHSTEINAAPTDHATAPSSPQATANSEFKKVKIKPQHKEAIAAAAQKTMARTEMECSTFGTEYTPMKHRMEDVKPSDFRQGSMDYVSTEGADLCDPSLAHSRAQRSLDGTANIYDEQITSTPLIDLRAHAILQGVIMSEILQRPAQRKWGKI